MKREWIRAGCVVVAALVVGRAAPGRAAVPEPPVTIYGSVMRGPAPASTGFVVAKRSGVEVARTSIGSGGAPLGEYVLRVPLFYYPPEQEGEQLPEETRVHDKLDLEVNGEPAGVAEIDVKERGFVAERNIVLSAAPPTDVDDDGVGNAVDNCSAFWNPNQVDTNNNGVGDACEALVNPPPVQVEIADPDNPVDPTTGYGRVTYVFGMSATEVTNAQYQAFLAAVAAADPAGLYNPLMGTDPRGGISRQGVPGSYAYRVRPSMANKPVNFVGWMDAARYANWLHKGKPTGPTGPGTTDTGAYDLTAASPALAASRLPGAHWALPSEDEWIKSGYYDPSAESYWLYPTGADTDPVPVAPNSVGEVMNAGANRANHESNADWNATDPAAPMNGNVTAVDGAGPESRSPVGTADQAGNVAEWTDAPAEGGKRVVRGGSYESNRVLLRRTAGTPGPSERQEVLIAPAEELSTIGFRVVELVPEPGAALSGVAALLAMLGVSRRKLRHSIRTRSWPEGRGTDAETRGLEQ